MRFAVYLIRCSVSGKGYVGKTSDPAKRWRDHKWNATALVHARSALYAAIRKHGAETFSFEVVEWCDSESLAFAREKHWISKFGTFGDGGYNMTDGGEGMSGARHTPESRALLAAAHRGMKASPETRAKMSASHKGRPNPANSKPGAVNPFFGRAHSDETKAILAEKARERYARGLNREALVRPGLIPWQHQREPWRRLMPRQQSATYRRMRKDAQRDDDLADRFVDVSPMEYEEDRHDW